MEKPTRIRYNKTLGGYVSRQSFLANTNMVNVEITTDPMRMTVRTVEGEVVETLDGKSVLELKIAAKDTLKSLGVNFADEVRAKKIKENVVDLSEVPPGFDAEDMATEELASDDAPEEQDAPETEEELTA